MSEHLSAAAAALSAPEELVMRSAAARATVTGSSVDDVLAAWAGGGSIVSTAPQADQPVPDEPAPVPAGGPDPAPMPEAEVAAAASAAVAPSITVAVEPVEEEEVDPVPLGRRAKLAARAGAITGGFLALVGLIAAIPMLLYRTTTVGESASSIAAVALEPLNGLLWISAFGLIIGAISGSLGHYVPGWFSKGARLAGTQRVGTMVGAVVGLVVGAACAGILIAPAETLTILDGETEIGLALVAVRVLVLVSTLGGIAAGMAAASLAQVLFVPSVMPEDESEESHVVRKRLADALAIPAMALLMLLVVALPLAWLFLSWHSAAPLFAIVASAGVLAFAGLSGSRPGMRISRGEFFVALAGIAVVVVLIVAVIKSLSTGEDEHVDPAPEEAAASAMIVG